MTATASATASASIPRTSSARPRVPRGTVVALRNSTLTVVGLIALVQLLTATGVIESYLLPMPSDVAIAMWTQSEALIRNGAATLRVAAIGFVIGNVAAIVVATGLVRWPMFERAAFPFVIIGRTLPFIALVPILVILMGQNDGPKIAVCAIGSFLGTVIFAVAGLRAAPTDVLELMHSLAAAPRQVVMKVRLYAAAPFIRTGLKLAAATCIVEATVAEWIVGSAGLGYLVKVTGFNFQLPLMWAAVAIAMLLTLALIALMSAVEAVATPWIPQHGMLDIGGRP